MDLNDMDTIIFDLDGVLIDSLDDLCASANHTLDKFGKRAKSKEEIKSYIGSGNKNFIEKSFETKDVGFVQKALSIFMKHYSDNCTNKTGSRYYVKELLLQLQDKNLAILTNKFSGLTKIIVKKLEIFDFFGLIVGPDMLNSIKPDPEGVLLIIDHFQSSPDRTVIIGDSDTDIYAGRNAGIHTCGLLNGIGDEIALIESNPDSIIHELSDLKLF